MTWGFLVTEMGSPGGEDIPDWGGEGMVSCLTWELGQICHSRSPHAFSAPSSHTCPLLPVWNVPPSPWHGLSLMSPLQRGFP